MYTPTSHHITSHHITSRTLVESRVPGNTIPSTSSPFGSQLGRCELKSLHASCVIKGSRNSGTDRPRGLGCASTVHDDEAWRGVAWRGVRVGERVDVAAATCARGVCRARAHHRSRVAGARTYVPHVRIFIIYEHCIHIYRYTHKVHTRSRHPRRPIPIYLES